MNNGAINRNDNLARWKPKSNRDMAPKELNYISDRESFKKRISERELLKEYRILITANKPKNCDISPKTLGLVVTFGPFKGKSLAEVGNWNPLFVKLFIMHSGFKFKQRAVQRVKKLLREYRLDQRLEDKYV